MHSSCGKPSRVYRQPYYEPVASTGRREAQEIAALAYSYWEARGCQGGSAWDDWFRAERELSERNWDYRG